MCIFNPRLHFLDRENIVYLSSSIVKSGLLIPKEHSLEISLEINFGGSRSAKFAILTGLVSLTVAMCFRENFAYIFLGGNDSVHVEITWNDLKSWYLSLKYQFCDFEK